MEVALFQLGIQTCESLPPDQGLLAMTNRLFAIEQFKGTETDGGGCPRWRFPGADTHTLSGGVHLGTVQELTDGGLQLVEGKLALSIVRDRVDSRHNFPPQPFLLYDIMAVPLEEGFDPNESNQSRQNKAELQGEVAWSPDGGKEVIIHNFLGKWLIIPLKDPNAQYILVANEQIRFDQDGKPSTYSFNNNSSELEFGRSETAINRSGSCTISVPGKFQSENHPPHGAGDVINPIAIGLVLFGLRKQIRDTLFKLMRNSGIIKR